MYKKPLVGLLSSGNEVTDVTSVLERKPGQIYDANRPSLQSALVSNGYPVLDLGIVLDHETDLEKALVGGLGKADILITTGGVSMGEKDLFKLILCRLGAKIHFGRVKLKPG